VTPFDLNSSTADLTSPTRKPIVIPFSIELPICCAVIDAGCKLNNAPLVPKSTHDLL
jgi:hypothetical protein